MTLPNPSTTPAFLSGGGEMARLIAAYPWHRTAMGPMDAWPAHVRHSIALMLRSNVPIVALYGPEGVMVYNDAYSVFAGGRHPQLLGSPVREGWPEVADFNDHVMRVGLAGGTLNYQDQELTLFRKGHAEQVWMNLDYSPILDDAGQPAAVLAIVVETTGKVIAERRLAGERARLHRMFEQGPSFIATFRGPQHVFEFANAAYRKLFDRDVAGLTAREAFPDLEGQGFFEQMDRVYQSGEPFRAEAASLVVRTEAGAAPRQLHLSFIYQPLFDEEGRVEGIFCEGFDVSETVRVNADLRRTQDWLEEGLGAAQMVAFEWDLAADQVRYSPNVRQVLGYADGTPQGGWSSIHPEDRPRLQAALDAAIRDCGSYQEVTRRIRPDTHQSLWTDTRGRVDRGADGKPRTMRGIIIDVSERVRSEHALREANRRKDEFLAMLAHELRNPLAPIANASVLLARAPGDAGVVRSMSEVITRQVRHMSHLVDDLLDVSRVTRGLVELERSEVDLAGVVQAALEQARPAMEAKKHSVSVHVADGEFVVEGDRTRLVQVLVNLLTNAAKFTPAGGLVSVHLSAEAGRALLSVQDNGTGMDASLLPHVFDLFTQGERAPDRSQGGLGIGLALVKALVGLHGGQVAAQSEGRGLGTRMSVSLPMVPGRRASAQAPEVAPAPAAPLRILVTDDNVDAAHSLASLLQMDGHTVHVCYDGHQAIGWARSNEPQVCVLDVGLPDMTGLELCARLRAMPHLHGTLFVALTGYGQAQDREATARAGFHHHLVKPVEPHALAKLLAQWPAAPATMGAPFPLRGEPSTSS